jgi:hypothetical protein
MQDFAKRIDRAGGRACLLLEDLAGTLAQLAGFLGIV